MLKVDNISVHYGRFQALSDVSLEIGETGSLHGVIGPNGAGKSTLMDAIVGRRRLSRGKIYYRGEDISARSVTWRRKNGMARSFQKSSIFPSLTVAEQLNLVADHLSDDQVDDVISVMDLGDCLDQKTGSIAYGVQRRVDVALALLGRPQILLLDEPGAGLSAAETLGLFHHLKQLVRERNITAVVVEHDVDAVFSTCDRITVMDLGRHLATGLPAEIRADQRVITAYLGSAG
jgi:branched-chain amino acid transport system ATP-binding protein